MEKPNQETVEQLRAQHGSRSLHLVSLRRKDDKEDQTFYFVMVGPDADEYKAFNDAVSKAKEEAKNVVDRNEKFAFVAREAVKKMTVWPGKEELKQILHTYPGFILPLSDKIHDHAGATAEVVSEKL